MKNIIIAAILLIGSLSAQAQEEFTIQGKIKGMKENTLVVFFRIEGKVGKGIARDTVRNESFYFKGKTEGEETERLLILCRGEGFPQMGLDVWVKPGVDIRISGENNYLYTWKVESPIEQQQLRNLFVEDARELWEAFQRIGVEEEQPALRDSLQNELKIRISAIEIERMKKLPVSEVWMDRLNDLAMRTKYTKNFPYKQEVIALYEGLTEEQKQTGNGKEIRAFLFPPTVVKEGDEMADADLFDLQGGVHHLSDYKGKYMLLDIWSSGCGPCILAMPEMKEVAEQYKERLTVISLSCDQEKSWRRASQEHDITWENLSDLQGTSGLCARYGADAIPCYLLISPEGKVLKKWSGYGKGSLKEMLEKLLGETEK